MAVIPTFWKRVIVTLFLLLVSACQSTCPTWIHEQTVSCSPAFSSQRLYLPASNNFDSLELELVSSQGVTRFYLNVFSLCIPPYQHDESKGAFLLIIDGNTYEVVADRLKGGQRLLIDPTTTELIAQALLANQTVEIRLGCYSSHITHNGFCFPL